MEVQSVGEAERWVADGGGCGKRYEEKSVGEEGVGEKERMGERRSVWGGGVCGEEGRQWWRGGAIGREGEGKRGDRRRVGEEG